MKALRRRALRRIFTLAGIIAASAGWSTLLWPPLRDYYSQGASLGRTLLELLKPVNSIYDDGIAVGWLFLLSTALLAIAVPLTVAGLIGRLIRYLERSEVDLSLLEMTLTLRFDEALRSCTTVRNQLFHANQPGLTAYHYSQCVDSPGGKIDPQSFEMDSILDGQRITKDFILRPGPQKFEAIEIFERPLPTSWLATYLPDWIVLALYRHTRMFGNVIVERGGQITLWDEHNDEDAIVQLNSLQSNSKNVSLVRNFDDQTAPRPSDLKCFMIRDRVVSALHPRCHTEGARRIYTARIAELDHAILRFQWNNRRLHAAPTDETAAELDPVSARPAPFRKPRWWHRWLPWRQSAGGWELIAHT